MSGAPQDLRATVPEVFDEDFVARLYDVEAVTNPKVFVRMLSSEGKRDLDVLLERAHQLFDRLAAETTAFCTHTPGLAMPTIDRSHANSIVVCLPPCCWVFLILVRVLQDGQQLLDALQRDEQDNLFVRAFSTQEARQSYSPANIIRRYPLITLLNSLRGSDDDTFQRPFLEFIRAYTWVVHLDIAALVEALSELVRSSQGSGRDVLLGLSYIFSTPEGLTVETFDSLFPLLDEGEHPRSRNRVLLDVAAEYAAFTEANEDAVVLMRLTRLLDAMDLIDATPGLELYETLLRLYRHSPRRMVELALRQRGHTPHAQLAIVLTLAFLFPDHIDVDTRIRKGVGSARKECSRLAARDVDGLALLLFDTEDDGQTPTEDWQLYAQSGVLVPGQQGFVARVVETLLSDATSEPTIRDPVSHIVDWLEMLLPLLPPESAKQLLDEGVHANPILSDDVKLAIASRFAEVCDPGVIRERLIERFATVLSNLSDGENGMAGLLEFVTSTLPLHLQRCGKHGPDLAAALLQKAGEAQVHRSIVFTQLARSLLRYVYGGDCTRLLETVTPLTRAPAGGGGCWLGMDAIRYIAEAIGDELRTARCLFETAAIDQGRSLGARLTALRQGIALPQAICSSCHTGLFVPCCAQPILHHLEAGKVIRIDRLLPEADLTRAHAFSCGHAAHHCCLRETRESLERRGAAVSRYLLGEVEACSYDAAYDISCPLCQ
ncbi:hypothetical protein GMRT_13155 [Giardia muris]|uniref:Uncharacterized protein n=1 Tax=Giardia muris TaxID=5742 RepID=A0A4Z1SP87_GIAMU|nr:hypothetical protein GMRT_13155 [Giardia muris]|eukprot:TNJ26675.1 hypothetical protein GMRT_13155 [Giardia muris]